MKNIFRISVVVLIALCTTNIFAFNLPTVSAKQYSAIESNLLEGVNSDNDGLKISSAYHLGEIKSQKSVLTLVKMLRDSDREEARIVAALSLAKIGTTQALYFVKQASKFDDSNRVKKLCTKFYNDVAVR